MYKACRGALPWQKRSYMVKGPMFNSARNADLQYGLSGRIPQNKDNFCQSDG